MRTRARLHLALCAAAVALLTAGAGPIRAEPGAEPLSPVVVAAYANVDRLVADVDTVFRTAQRPAIADFLQGVIDSLDGLAGVDRTRPLGAALFLDPGREEPRAVGFLPISGDVATLSTTVGKTGQLKLEPGESDGRYWLTGPDGKLAVRIEGEFAWLAESFDRLGGLEGVRLRLDEMDFDTADGRITAYHAGVPPLLIGEMLSAARIDAEKNQAQRPNESEAEYALRKNVSNGLVGLLEALMSESRTGVIEWTVPENLNQQPISVAAHWRVADGGTLDQLVAALPPETGWHPAGRADAAVAIGLNLRIPEGGRELLLQLIELVRTGLEGGAPPPQVRQAADTLLNSLEATTAAGLLRSELRLVPAGEHLAAVGCVPLLKADELAAAVRTLFAFFQIFGDGETEFEMFAAEAADIVLHRIQPGTIRDRDKKIYGPELSFYVGAGEEGLWQGFGGPQTAEVLATLVEAVRDYQPTQSADSLLVQADVSAQPIVSQFASGSPQQAILEEAFASEDSGRASLRVHTHDDGLRVEIELADGFARLLGLVVAKQVQ